jgi:pyruvate dehydrogenase E1 component beta subunit
LSNRTGRSAASARKFVSDPKEIFDELDAPILRVSQEDVPMPYNERLEKAVLPNAEKLIAAVKKVCYA